MRYYVLATDYDGTLAHNGKVDEDTFAALERLRTTRRKLILVTGRRLDDLKTVFDRLDIFDRIVAKNGAVVYDPSTRDEHVLGEAPPPGFAERLRAQGAPVDEGRVIVATWSPHETTALALLREMGLDHHIIFNKGAVMILPLNVNKASGLKAALADLELSPHNVVAVGDAENDLALLQLCEFAAAVDNALPSVKEAVDWVTPRDHGAGVTDLIDQLIADDLQEFDDKLARRGLSVGVREGGEEMRISPYATNILLAGSSGSGKSTFATGFMERLAEQGYQYCCIDPEGDYTTLPDAVILGTPTQAPVVREVASVLSMPDRSCVVNMVAVPLQERPAVFANVFTEIMAMRASKGRPHWIMIDEAHHLWPREWEAGRLVVPDAVHGMMFVTLHPDHLANAVTKHINAVIVLGVEPEERYVEFARATDCAVPRLPNEALEPGEVWWWRVGDAAIHRIRAHAPTSERRRHVRKYAEGELEPERSFYFRGPEEALNLRAQNLIIFLQLAEGVDEPTWTHHLRNGDYSRWFRTAIKDEELAAAAEEVERDSELSSIEARKQIAALVEQRYTLPA